MWAIRSIFMIVLSFILIGLGKWFPFMSLIGYTMLVAFVIYIFVVGRKLDKEERSNI